MQIYFANLFEPSKELECHTVNICSMLASTQVLEDDCGQLNFKDTIYLRETKEEKAPKLKFKTLTRKLKYVYLKDQQTDPMVISSQLTTDQEEKNAKNYKEWMEIFHDKRITRKSFRSRQKVFFFNSLLHLFPGKLHF